MGRPCKMRRVRGEWYLQKLGGLSCGGAYLEGSEKTQEGR